MSDETSGKANYLKRATGDAGHAVCAINVRVAHLLG